MKAFILFGLCFVFCVCDTYNPKDKIHLRDLQVITLHHGKYTTGRRTRPIPQLTCIGGTNRCKFLPETVQCYNRGWDGETVQWECKTSLDKNLRFNKIEVTCEGYDYPEDDYVLVGSCALEYSIDRIDGSTPFPQPGQERPIPKETLRRASERARQSGFVIRSRDEYESDFTIVAILAFIAGVMYLIYKNFIEPGEHSRRQSQSTAPPPPGFNVGPGYYPSSTDYCSTGGTTSHQTGSFSRPGFWSGFSLGGILGWWARGTTQSSQPRTERVYPTVPPDTEHEQEQQHSWWSGYFGKSSNTYRRRRVDRSPPRESIPTSEPPTSLSNIGAYTASGFGGTKKR